MMQATDYIYYRMYSVYKKANDDPNFTTPLLFSAILAFYINIPIIILCGHYFHISTIVFVLIGLAITALVMIIILRRYNKKKLRKIFVKYKYHKCNKWIKNWMLYVGIVLIFPLAPFTFGLWGYFFKFIGLI